MPELPEVETTRAGLENTIKNFLIQKVEVRRRDLRQPIPVRLEGALAGTRIVGVRRRAKYLLLDVDSGEVLLVHLGMSGSFSVRIQEDALLKHDHVILYLEGGLRVVFHDPRRFGVIDLFASAREHAHPLLAHLGPEPFSDAFSVDYLKENLRRRKTAIKPVLMDQQLVVGVGNIYASESLFLCGINPQLQSDKVVNHGELIAAIRATLQSAIASGGSTLRDFLGASGKGGYFQHQFRVYNRAAEACFTCGKPIQIQVQSGRSTYWCATCQPIRKN